MTAESIVGAHETALATIGQALSENGDILVYGCDFTAGEAGLEAAMALGGVAGADIAASTDRTGHADFGGDWDLETTIGTVDATTVSATQWYGLPAPPEAVDDTNTVSADQTTAVTGNVLSNDSEPDGESMSVTEVHGYPVSLGVPFQSTYGTITLSADGTCSYVVDTTNSSVSGLTNGQSLQDVIAYAVADSYGVPDGPTSTHRTRAIGRL